MSSRKASSGLRMRGSSAGSGPSPATFQFFMSMPFGTYMKARRTGALGAAANAGTIESRNGSATVAPTPFRKVLRGRDLPVTIIEPPREAIYPTAEPLPAPLPTSVSAPLQIEQDN